MDNEEVLEETYDNSDEKPGSLFCERAYKFYCEKLKKRVSTQAVNLIDYSDLAKS